MMGLQGFRIRGLDQGTIGSTLASTNNLEDAVLLERYKFLLPRFGLNAALCRFLELFGYCLAWTLVFSVGSVPAPPNFPELPKVRN